MRASDERVATEYVLHKHHLSEDSQAVSVLEVVNDIIALHATSAATPYLSLLTRMRNFKKEYLDSEFYLKRNLVRLQAMRGTLFITTTELAPILYQATKISEPYLLKWLSKWGISASEYREVAEKLNDVFKGGGKTLHEIKKAVPKGMVRSVAFRTGRTISYRGTNINSILYAMAHKGIVISEKGAETFRTTRVNRFWLFSEVYPNLNLDSVKSEEAKTSLVKHHIKAFGPVTEEDIAWWTGLGKTDVGKALTSIGKELLSVRISGFKNDYFMLETDYKQFIKFKPLKTRSVSLLPYEDPYTKGYKVRDRLVDMAHEKKAYVGGGVQPTILFNGKIIGTWSDIEEGKEPIKLTFFQQPKRDLEREVVQKAKAVARVMVNRELTVEVEVES